MSVKPGAKVSDERSAAGGEAEAVVRRPDKSVDIFRNYGARLAEQIRRSPTEPISQLIGREVEVAHQALDDKGSQPVFGRQRPSANGGKTGLPHSPRIV